MRGLFAMAGIFALLAGCGYDPHPKDGKLPCTEGCPSGYVCRSDNRCWRANSPVIDSIDSGIDSGAAKDSAVPEVGGLDASAGIDGPALDADRDVPLDNNVAVDVGAGIDVASADMPAPVDTGHADGAGGSTVDAQRGTGGAGGGGGSGGTSGGGGASGTGGSTGGASGSGGSGGAGGWDSSIPDAAPDAPIANSDAACVPETDQQMCTRLVKNCNAVTDFDNCGKSRLIASCGTCTGTLVCGSFVANVCPTICVLDQSALDQCVLGP